MNSSLSLSWIRVVLSPRAAPREISLPARQTWSAPLRAGERVWCRRGVVWLTHSGDATDFILRAGESFVAPQHGHVVAQNLGATSAILTLEANR